MRQGGAGAASLFRISELRMDRAGRVAYGDTNKPTLVSGNDNNQHAQDTITLKLKLTQAFISFDLICNRVRQFASCAAALPGAIQWPLRKSSPSTGFSGGRAVCYGGGGVIMSEPTIASAPADLRPVLSAVFQKLADLLRAAGERHLSYPWTLELTDPKGVLAVLRISSSADSTLRYEVVETVSAVFYKFPLQLTISGADGTKLTSVIEEPVSTQEASHE